MEEVAEGFVRGLFRILKTIVIEGFCETLCFWLGRIFLLAVTFGRYPKGEQIKAHEGRITFVGFLVIVAIVAIGVLLSV